MAEIKISEMANATVTEDDLVVVVSNGITKKTPVGNLLVTEHPNYPRWRSIRKGVLSAKIAGISDPDLVKFADDGAESAGVYAYAFDATKEEEVFLHLQLPHDWKSGTDIIPHIHWARSTSDTGHIKWGIEYTFASPLEIFGNTTIIYETCIFPEVTPSHTHLETVFDAIDTSAYDYSYGSSSVIMARVFRTIADEDNYDADVFLLFIDVHYQFCSQGKESL